jgi:hypothetical protein
MIYISRIILGITFLIAFIIHGFVLAIELIIIKTNEVLNGTTENR